MAPSRSGKAAFLLFVLWIAPGVLLASTAAKNASSLESSPLNLDTPAFPRHVEPELSSMAIMDLNDTRTLLNQSEIPPSANRPLLPEGSEMLDDDKELSLRSFISVAILAGAVVRFLTSTTFRKFLIDVFDPLSWTA